MVLTMDKLPKAALNSLKFPGWHEGMLSDGTKVLLFGSTMVRRVAEGYVPLEGPYRGRIVLIDRSAIDDVTPVITEKICADYYQSKGLFELPIGSFATAKSQRRLTNGKYFLCLPEYPNTRLVRSEYLRPERGGSPFATSWFRLMHESGFKTRYFLHLGEISDGCITVEFTRHGHDWFPIVRYLAAHRRPNGTLLEINVMT